MKHELDEYAYINSFVHDWEPRLKMIGLLVLIFAFAFVQDLRLLPPMLIITAAIFVLSRLPWRFLASRLKIPGLFIGFLVVSLPFVSGQTPLAELGPLTIWEEGVASAVLIIVRFVCIITLSLILFGTTKITTNLKAMRALRVPDIMVDMILLTYRYLFEIGYYFSSTRTAVRMRGYEGSKLSMNNIRTLASLMGNLLVRSYEQAERVYKAMILRGYGYGPLNYDEFNPQMRDKLYLMAVCLIALAFISLQIYLQTEFA